MKFRNSKASLCVVLSVFLLSAFGCASQTTGQKSTSSNSMIGTVQTGPLSYPLPSPLYTGYWSNKDLREGNEYSTLQFYKDEQGVVWMNDYRFKCNGVSHEPQESRVITSKLSISTRYPNLVFVSDRSHGYRTIKVKNKPYSGHSYYDIEHIGGEPLEKFTMTYWQLPTKVSDGYCP